jgi:hypothetical protein
MIPRIGTTRILGSDFPSRVNSLSGSAWLGKSLILGAAQPVIEMRMIKRAVIKNFRMSVHLKCIGKLGSKVQGSGFRVQQKIRGLGYGVKHKQWGNWWRRVNLYEFDLCLS